MFKNVEFILHSFFPLSSFETLFLCPHTIKTKSHHDSLDQIKKHATVYLLLSRIENMSHSKSIKDI